VTTRLRHIGQSLVEYLVCLSAISLALFLPMGDDPPVLQQLTSALTATVRGIQMLLSIS
jgi:hypothetical protein